MHFTLADALAREPVEGDVGAFAQHEQVAGWAGGVAAYGMGTGLESVIR